MLRKKFYSALNGVLRKRSLEARANIRSISCGYASTKSVTQPNHTTSFRLSRDHERMRLESYDSLPTLGGTLSTEELGRQRLWDYYQICVGLVIVIRILRCDQRSDDSKS
jgi:hypothetical protein